MKKCIYLTAIVVLFCFMPATKVLATEKFFGKYCWQVFSDEGEPYWAYMFSVYEKEGGQFLLLGSVDYGVNGLSASHGNAIFLDGRIKLNIVSSDYEDGDGEVWTETFMATLDAKTLAGEWHALSLETTDKVNVTAVSEHGTMERMECKDTGMAAW